MANEKRLIEYDAVYKYAFDGAHGGNLEDEDFAAIINAIDAVPTVDAVPVVRCEKCKFCRTFYPCKEIDKEPIQVWYCDLYRCNRKPDEFCSDGERKDNERKAD